MLKVLHRTINAFIFKSVQNGYKRDDGLVFKLCIFMNASVIVQNNY